jgi:hypothetical protein
VLPFTCCQAFIAQSVRRRIFDLEVRGSYPVGARIFAFLLSFLFFFLYIQMFFYTIMKLFITLFENVNKSRTSAGRLSLKSSHSKIGQRNCTTEPRNMKEQIFAEDYRSVYTHTGQLWHYVTLSLASHRYICTCKPWHEGLMYQQHWQVNQNSWDKLRDRNVTSTISQNIWCHFHKINQIAIGDGEGVRVTTAEEQQRKRTKKSHDKMRATDTATLPRTKRCIMIGGSNSTDILL